MAAFWRGITAHFLLRRPDWIMAGILAGVGLALWLNPRLFTSDAKAYQYVYLSVIVSQAHWALICLAIGLVRLGALAVNGTFPPFAFSPHLRLVGAALTCFLWLQVALAVMFAGEWNTAAPVYLGLLFFDLSNVYVAALEIERGARNSTP